MDVGHLRTNTNHNRSPEWHRWSKNNTPLPVSNIILIRRDSLLLVAIPKRQSNKWTKRNPTCKPTRQYNDNIIPVIWALFHKTENRITLPFHPTHFNTNHRRNLKWKPHQLYVWYARMFEFKRLLQPQWPCPLRFMT